MIRRGEPRDAPAVAAICNHYVVADHRVLRETPVEVAEMARRIGSPTAGPPAFVLEERGAVVGYSYATEWPGPKVHPATLETTIVLAPEVCGRGLGRRLYATLLATLEDEGVHTAIACIALPNEASLALHAAFGFEPLARLEGAAVKGGRRFDLECWGRRLAPG